MKKKNLEKYGDSLQSVFDLVEKLTMVQRIIISVVVLALLIAGFVVFSYKPKYEELGIIEKQYEKVKKDLDVAKEKASRLAALQQEWTEKEEQFKLAMNALPDKKEIPSLLGEISRAGNESGLDFQVFQPLGEAPKQFYAEIPVSLKLSGEYQSIFSFFEKVSDMSRIVNLKDINMHMGAAKGDQEESLLVSTDCKAVTYRFLSPEESAEAKDNKRTKKK